MFFQIPTVTFNNLAPTNPPNFTFTGPGNSTLGAVVSALLPYVLTAAGLVSFVFILFAGFQFLMSQGNPKQVEEARKKLTEAIIGFIVVFSSYWIIQIVEKILGVSIL